MTDLRPDLPVLPPYMLGLPLDHRGFPVPWFVAFVNGEPDFRVVRPGGPMMAFKKKICWLCGKPLGAYKTFVIGPMCAINRVISEPPSHRACATFAVQACPFLTQPRMRRNEKDIPEETHKAAGIALERNPGVICLWITRTYFLENLPDGVLFRLGDPVEISWWTKGRPALRAEVDESIQTGLPFLRELAEKDGPGALAELERLIRRAQPLLPAA